MICWTFSQKSSHQPPLACEENMVATGFFCFFSEQHWLWHSDWLKLLGNGQLSTLWVCLGSEHRESSDSGKAERASRDSLRRLLGKQAERVQGLIYKIAWEASRESPGTLLEDCFGSRQRESRDCFRRLLWNQADKSPMTRLQYP